MKSIKRLRRNVLYLLLLLVVGSIAISGFLYFQLSGLTYALGQSHQSVPVIPNESLITGKVISYCVVSASTLDIQPVIPIWILEISVETSEDVPEMRNFTKDKVGKSLSVYSKEKLSLDLFEQTVKARVTYSGDEKGGRFWVKEVEVLKTE